MWSRFFLKWIFFVEGSLFRFYSIFNASSQLKTFSYPVISTMLLFHTLGQAESIYVCSFKIYTLERKATLSLRLVDQCNRIKWLLVSDKFFFLYVWNEWMNFFPSEKLIDPWKKSKCLPRVICLHNTLTNNYLHIFSSLCTHMCIYVSLSTCSII